MSRPDLTHLGSGEIVSGTQAGEAMLKLAAGRLSFRRTRDVLPTRIEAQRLVLRAPIRGDVPALTKLADNPRIAEKLSRLPHPYRPADAIAFVEIFAQRADERPFAITLGDGSFIGIVGFSYAMGEHPELGYWLGEPHWGQGFATEAVKALLEAAFATGAYPAVRARVLEGNHASIRVLDKAGFRAMGTSVEPIGGPAGGRPVLLFRREQPK